MGEADNKDDNENGRHVGKRDLHLTDLLEVPITPATANEHHPVNMMETLALPSQMLSSPGQLCG